MDKKNIDVVDFIRLCRGFQHIQTAVVEDTQNFIWKKREREKERKREREKERKREREKERKRNRETGKETRGIGPRKKQIVRAQDAKEKSATKQKNNAQQLLT